MPPHRVTVSGLDKSLEADFCDAWVYNLADVCHSGKHRWADIFFEGGGSLLGGKGTIENFVADLARLDEVVELE